MIFAFFHVIGLIFLIKYYKLQVKLTNLILVVAIFVFYFLTIDDSSYLAMLFYTWLVYFLNTYILFGKMHISYHVSMIVVILGLFVSAVVEQNAFMYYRYMASFSWEHLLMMLMHLGLMILVLVVHQRITFYKESLYASRFTYINMLIHVLILMIHLLKDLDLIELYVSNVDTYYYQSLFYIVFVFYLMLIVSSVFYENKRLEERELFLELRDKQADLKELFETKPSRFLQDLIGLAAEEKYEDVLKETRSFMAYRKKVSHKRVLDRLNDDLLAFVTMETINKEKNIAFEVVVEKTSSEPLSSRHYFLEMYGIVLDNAVKAAKKANLRYVKILFEESRVVVENSYVKEDIRYLEEKISARGKENRINGLKLLEYLQEESGIAVKVDVSYRVVVRLEVDYA